MRSGMAVVLVLMAAVVACGRTELTSAPPIDGVVPGRDGGRDAATPDGGAATDAGVDGGCSVVPRASPEALARSPRAVRWLEELVLHGSPGAFVIDDERYARAERELRLLVGADAGRIGFLPSWGRGFFVELDADGADLFRSGQYHAWDCLNAYYRGTPSPVVPPSLVSVDIAPVVWLPALAADYAALPHVLTVQPMTIETCGGCDCGSDTCLDASSDAGRWLWISHIETPSCQTIWLRMRTERDGGALLERWADAGTPPPWFDDLARCRRQP